MNEQAKWKAIESIAKFGIVAGCMAFNASHFDKTEITALVMIALGVGGFDGVKSIVKGASKQSGESE